MSTSRWYSGPTAAWELMDYRKVESLESQVPCYGLDHPVGGDSNGLSRKELKTSNACSHLHLNQLLLSRTKDLVVDRR